MCWNRLPCEAVDSPSLEMFKVIWSPGQPNLVLDLVAGNLACDRELKLDEL